MAKKKKSILWEICLWSIIYPVYFVYLIYKYTLFVPCKYIYLKLKGNKDTPDGNNENDVKDIEKNNEFMSMIAKYIENKYCKGEEFESIKSEMSEYTINCNELNQHIEELKGTYSNIKKTNYGRAVLTDNSEYNFKREHQVEAQHSEFIYECSASICKNVGSQPFKYLCKYFNIEPNEKTLEDFENVLNSFSAVEEGKELLNKQHNSILNSVKDRVPTIILKYREKEFLERLGFNRIDFTSVYYPVYSFRYISPGGNKSSTCDIPLDIENLENLVVYLSELVEYRKTVAGQRALMTSKLREFIKIRDNYTCKNCGVSISDEPHLLLEIDHIIPVSKGGLSTEENLQTLCWKCNRSKGSK